MNSCRVKRNRLRRTGWLIVVIIAIPTASGAIDLEPGGGVFGSYALTTKGTVGNRNPGAGAEGYVRAGRWVGGGLRFGYHRFLKEGTHWFRTDLVADAHFLPTEKRLDPYLGFGVGFARARTINALGLAPRAGLNVWFTDKVGGMFTTTYAIDIGRRQPTAFEASRIVMHGVVLDLGMRFRF
ncbi:MAG: hypothetical protein HYV03_02785 [Deltaproteobacteria bacterium]|nr:hypothetical protein [Deltaproteobacteria bacterium]